MRTPGLEPGTPCMSSKYSNHLSYARQTYKQDSYSYMGKQVFFSQVWEGESGPPDR